jgi:hypothetical protein
VYDELLSTARSGLLDHLSLGGLPQLVDIVTK